LLTSNCNNNDPDNRNNHIWFNYIVKKSFDKGIDLKFEQILEKSRLELREESSHRLMGETFQTFRLNSCLHMILAKLKKMKSPER